MPILIHGAGEKPPTAEQIGALALAGGTMTGPIAMGGSKITGLGTPTATSDAVNKGYVDLRSASFGKFVYGSRTAADCTVYGRFYNGRLYAFIMAYFPTASDADALTLGLSGITQKNFIMKDLFQPSKNFSVAARSSTVLELTSAYFGAGLQILVLLGY